ncbi:hypothetical protein ACE6H2_023340 [Prunus campanulata]
MKVPLTATVLVLIIWLIASPNRSCTARIVVPDDFDLFDYGAVHHNTQTDDEGLSQEAFPEGWETEATTRDSFNRANAQTEKYDPQIQGSIVAPNNIGAWTNKEMWIQFSNVQGLSVNGGGRIDGNGAVWWKACGSKGCQRPTSLHFNKCHGFQLSRLAFFNSPKNHISICSCNGPRVFGLFIWAPKDSPNTDGIDISESTRVTIQSSHIATGDDCIAINSGSSYIKIRDIKCGPGHGIRKITFEGITFEDTKNPIIIDQHYFAKPTSAMDISKVK